MFLISIRPIRLSKLGRSLDVKLSKGSAFYRHGYVLIHLDDAKAHASYYEDINPDTPLFEEGL